MGRDDATKLDGGRYVFDRSDPDKRLGRGGFATVWLGHDTKTGRQVAGKFFDLGGAQPPEARRRFEDEARALESLEHTFIVRVLQNDAADEDEPVVVLEYGHQSLRQELLEHPDELLAKGPKRMRWLLQIAQALRYLHSREFVHRDLKPENVLIKDEYGESVRLIDLGLVQLPEGSETRAGRMGCGSPGYSAPEQMVDFASAISASDCYSFGVVAWELATGERPLSGAGGSGILGPKAAEGPSMPAEWKELVASCLELDPKDRPADGAALVDAIEAMTQVATLDLATDGGRPAEKPSFQPSSPQEPSSLQWLPQSQWPEELRARPSRWQKFMTLFRRS